MVNPRERELSMEAFSAAISTGWHLAKNRCKVPHLGRFAVDDGLELRTP
jgi:hypothetical protein